MSNLQRGRSNPNLTAQEFSHQKCCQTAVDNEVGEALNVARVGPVNVNPVRVEAQR
ncbi:hypothetical protein FQZ97_1266070 [compost metagenome]